MVQRDEKHFTTSVYIFSKEAKPRVLLLFHKKNQKWMQPGGHINPNETPPEAAIREVLEETGMDLTPYMKPTRQLTEDVLDMAVPVLLQQQRIEAYNDEPAHYHLDMGYVVHVPHKLPEPAQDESLMVNWFTLEQLDKLDMFDNVRTLIKELFAGINSSSIHDASDGASR